MITKDFTHKKLPLLIFLLAVFMFIMSMVSNNVGRDTDIAARKAGDRLEQRIKVLDKYIAQASDTEKCDLL